ncbi:MAG: hypothetical protein CEN90_614 [Parcubacteria group bacterium Licking1014_17]|nr:MAG: hypothetical protein CEN90_614 [Parcubacteria group bacterium Licking1014_17]
MERKEKVKNHPGPCLGKNCSWCCNPVKVHENFPDDMVPTNEKGEKIWRDKKETIIPESSIERGRPIRIKTFECANLDKKTGKCKDYENRPDICRKTSCIDENSIKPIDEQYKEMVGEKFIKPKTK